MKLYLIKPLEWTDNKSGSVSVYKDHVHYFIDKYEDLWELAIDERNTPTTFTLCGSLDEAKSKAQEDWNNRISQYLTEYKEEK